MSLNISGISAAHKSSPADKKKELRAKGEFVVEKGMTLTQIAKKFNMSVEEFKKMTGLKSSSLSVGQIIKNVPTATVKQGKGLTAVARDHGMSLTDFCKLNGISKDYKPKAGEAFYVYPKTGNKPASTQTRKETPKPQQTTSPKPQKTEPKTAAKTETKQPEDANLSTASDIAEALKKSAKMTAAVGKEKFNTPFNKIDKDNVIEVIQKYDKISPKESLIDMISSEWGSSKGNRMNSITKLYDTLAERVGNKIATPEKREEFMAELKNQYDSWGFVSTEKMDNMINELIDSYQKSGKVQNNTANGVKLSGNKAKVKLGNGKELTSEQLKKDADVTAAKEKRPVKRPEPVVDKNGNIVAGVEIHNPTGKGPLNGKTIIVNAGHGGYNPKTGIFDPGTDAKDKNGKVIEEWYKNKNFTDEIIPQLTAQGAKVVFMNGSAAAVMKAKEKYKNADMFISIHCDSAPSNQAKRGQTILYRDAGDKRLAEAVEAKVETHDWLSKDSCNSKSDTRNLGVLKAVGNMPSILIETGYQSNATDLANIDSSKFRKEFAQLLTQGVIDYVSHK